MSSRTSETFYDSAILVPSLSSHRVRYQAVIRSQSHASQPLGSTELRLPRYQILVSEEIIAKSREAHVLLGRGNKVVEIVKDSVPAKRPAAN